MREQALQPLLRPHQRHADEEIVVQQPFPERAGGRQPPALERLDLIAGAGAQQLVGTQEIDEGGQLLRAGRKRPRGADRLENQGGIAQAPVREQFELEPADAEEAVAHRILDRPRGRPVPLRRRFVKPQVLAQRRQKPPHRRHQPSHSRSAASGRLNR